mgnify:CR=1 FL=1
MRNKSRSDNGQAVQQVLFLFPAAGYGPDQAADQMIFFLEGIESIEERGTLLFIVVVCGDPGQPLFPVCGVLLLFRIASIYLVQEMLPSALSKLTVIRDGGFRLCHKVIAERILTVLHAPR